MKKRVKTRTLVIAGLGAVGLIAAGVAVSKRLKSPITSITWNSTEVGKLDIAWYDDERGAVYKIYWSNRKGIRVKDPNTYLHSIQVTTLTHVGESLHHKATIAMHEEWVYIIITKKGYISSEFEARIEQRKNFNVKNLNVEVLKKPEGEGDVSILVTVLDQIEAYRILLYLPDGTCFEYDFNVENTKTANLKFPNMFDSLVHVAAKNSGKWSSPEFLFLLREFLIFTS
jgi:hypothetical protein